MLKENDTCLSNDKPMATKEGDTEIQTSYKDKHTHEHTHPQAVSYISIQGFLNLTHVLSKKCYSMMLAKHFNLFGNDFLHHV